MSLDALAWPFGFALVMAFLRLFEGHTQNLTFKLLLSILLINVFVSASIVLAETSPSPIEFFGAMFAALGATSVGAILGTGVGYLANLVRADLAARRMPEQTVSEEPDREIDPMVKRAVDEAMARHRATKDKHSQNGN